MSKIVILLATVLVVIGTACSGYQGIDPDKYPGCDEIETNTRVKVTGPCGTSVEVEGGVKVKVRDKPATSQPAEGEEGEGGDQPQPIQQPGWTPLTHTMDISLEFPVLEELEGGNLLIDLENVTLTFTDPTLIETSGQADLNVPDDVTAEVSQDTPYLGNTCPERTISGRGSAHTMTGTMVEVLTEIGDQGVVELRGCIVGLFLEHLSPTDIALLAAEGVEIELEEPIDGGGDDDMIIGEWNEDIAGPGSQKDASNQCPPIGRIIYY